MSHVRITKILAQLVDISKELGEIECTYEAKSYTAENLCYAGAVCDETITAIEESLKQDTGEPIA